MRTKTLVKNCIVQIDASPFAQWYLNHYGLNIGICCFIQAKRPKKPPRPQQNQRKLKKNWRKEERIESSTLKLLKSSLNKDCWLALALDLANQAELMVIFWKEKNSNFILRRSTKERNDLYLQFPYLNQSRYVK